MSSRYSSRAALYHLTLILQHNETQQISHMQHSLCTYRIVRLYPGQNQNNGRKEYQRWMPTQRQERRPTNNQVVRQNGMGGNPCAVHICYGHMARIPYSNTAHVPVPVTVILPISVCLCATQSYRLDPPRSHRYT